MSKPLTALLPITFPTEFGPELWALLTYDDVAEPTPVWVHVSADVRDFSTRGRDSELSEFEAGTATVTLDNREKAYDPVTHTYIRPMNQVWLLAQYGGVTESIFKGYVESWDQQWPAPGMSDALAIINAADEFKVLALSALPNMDPPRDTYADCVAFDNPTYYWRWSDANMTSTTTIEVTELPTYHWTYNGFEWDTISTPHTVTGFGDWVSVSGEGFQSTYSGSAIVGDLQDLTAGLGGNLVMNPGYTFKANSFQVGDPDGGSAFTVETWFYKTNNPAGNTNFMYGPETNSAGTQTWYFALNTTGVVTFTGVDSGLTGRTVTSTTALANNTWYHLVGEMDGANMRLFVNGVQEASGTSGTGTFRATNQATTVTMAISGITGVTALWMDETCVYAGTALPVARALAHYQAGALRGFRGGNALGLPHLRAGGVLDAITSDAPRNIRVGTRGMQPVFQHGQDPLTELRKCALAEIPNGTLFIANDGTVTLLDALHRTVPPWNGSIMVFDDDGTDNPYADLDVDFSDSFLVNEWNASRTGGSLVTSTNAASVSAFGKRSQTLSDLPLTQDADVLTITAAMLSKYKDPLMRAKSISLDCSDAGVAAGVFGLELCDKVSISRTTPGGGTRLVMTPFIQKIDVTGSNDQTPWKVVLGLGDAAAPTGG